MEDLGVEMGKIISAGMEYNVQNDIFMSVLLLKPTIVMFFLP